MLARGNGADKRREGFREGCEGAEVIGGSGKVWRTEMRGEWKRILSKNPEHVKMQ